MLRAALTHRRELVEHSLTSWDHKVPADDNQIGKRHERENGPKPVGPMGRNVLRSPKRGVAVKSVVAHGASCCCYKCEKLLGGVVAETFKYKEV